jgi:hypothetical protein
MTKKIIASYHLALLLTMFGFAGITSVYASEVTGTLSSDSSDTSLSTNGNIEGTVTNSGNNSGGGSRNGGGSSRNQPGSVLGATTDNNTESPSFPNAGENPLDGTPDTATLWTVIASIIWSVVSF